MSVTAHSHTHTKINKNRHVHTCCHMEKVAHAQKEEGEKGCVSSYKGEACVCPLGVEVVDHKGRCELEGTQAACKYSKGDSEE